MIRIRLEPLGKTLELPPGSPLQDVLFACGVEFPCGGRGRCRKCRVRVLAGELPPTEEERRILSASEIAAGWRLACRARAWTDVTIEAGQWEAVVLADETSFPYTPSEGLGIAVDVGTTTLVAQLVDLETAHVVGVKVRLNPQAVCGADVMTRVEAALEPGGLRRLSALVREAVGEMIRELVTSYGNEPPVRHVVLVGNTVMYHLFCEIDPEPLAHYPFEPSQTGLQTFTSKQLNWPLPAGTVIQFLPCLGGFVGSDILAGILATRLHETQQLTVLLDLGTNGEVVVGSAHRIWCASTAAGPAFEGGRISMGMRAATGAIAEAFIEGSELRFRVLGGGEPRGICGSGLVDVIAAGLKLGRILPGGRLANGSGEWPLVGPIKLTQRDIRELQLAKAAIAAGSRLLLKRAGACSHDVQRVYLAGAFGNYVNPASARAIGLLAFPEERVVHAGNTALTGAKIALFYPPEEREFVELRKRVEHVPLAGEPDFEETFVAEMCFPPPEASAAP